MQTQFPKSNRPAPLWLQAPRGVKFILGVLVVTILSIVIFKREWLKPVSQEHAVPTEDAVAMRGLPINATFESIEGNPVKIESFRGSVVLVNFWASWCGPCLVELPSIRELSQKINSSEDFRVVAINVEDKETAQSAANEMWKTLKVPFPTYADFNKKAMQAFQVESLPTTFILDKQGRIVMRASGANDWAGEKIVELIQQLKNESQTALTVVEPDL